MLGTADSHLTPRNKGHRNNCVCMFVCVHRPDWHSECTSYCGACSNYIIWAALIILMMMMMTMSHH